MDKLVDCLSGATLGVAGVLDNINVGRSTLGCGSILGSGAGIRGKRESGRGISGFLE